MQRFINTLDTDKKFWGHANNSRESLSNWRWEIWKFSANSPMAMDVISGLS
jgi:hypothetical protein